MLKKILGENEIDVIRRFNFSKLEKYSNIDHVFLNINEHFSHNWAVFLCVWHLRNGIRAELLPRLVNEELKIGEASIRLDLKDEERPIVLTNVTFKKKGLFDKPKKSDIYILDNDTCVQIVNSEKEVEKYKNYDKTVIVKV